MLNPGLMEERRRSLAASIEQLRAAVDAANVAVTNGWQQMAEDVSDLQAAVVAPAGGTRPQTTVTAKLDPHAYDELVVSVVTRIARQVRRGKTFLVVSRGDDRLLEVRGRRGQHFPQADDGRYAGHHPADSSAALAHLEQLHRAGAEYVVFPSTAFWWFDHYSELARYLNTRAWRIWGDDRCVIYRLPSRHPWRPIGRLRPRRRSSDVVPKRR